MGYARHRIWTHSLPGPNSVCYTETRTSNRERNNDDHSFGALPYHWRNCLPAPDLASVLNSRLATSLEKIQSAFTDCQTASNFHPNKGYWWEWPGHKPNKVGKEEEEKNIQKIATKFQKNRVDILLSKLQRNHPHIFFQTQQHREPIKLNAPEPQKSNDEKTKSRKIKSDVSDVGPIAKRPRTQ